ncbi:MAG: PEP-CTERM sorting domain-containing protein [Planctomycetota bacterium]
MNRKLTCMLTLGVLVFSPLASAAVISFEGQSVGDTFNGKGTVVDTAPGITDGTQAVRYAYTGNGFDKFFEDFFPGVGDDGAEYLQPDTITADVTFDTTVANGGFTNFVLALFTNGGGFQQLSSSNNFIGGSGQKTVAFDLTAAQQQAIIDANANDEFVKLDIIVSSDTSGSTTGTVTVDNITLNAVPEPASLLLLGLGGLAALGRGRRSA